MLINKKSSLYIFCILFFIKISFLFSQEPAQPAESARPVEAVDVEATQPVESARPVEAVGVEATQPVEPVRSTEDALKASEEIAVESEPEIIEDNKSDEKKESSELSQDEKAALNFKGSNFFDHKTKIKNPFTLRDPFKPMRSRRTSEGLRYKNEMLKDGIYTNIKDITSSNLESIKVVGILLGEDRRAIVSEGEDTMVLREGNKLGPNHLEIKAILPGGVVLVEKILNIYGQEEYFETLIPLSEQKSASEKVKK